MTREVHIDLIEHEDGNTEYSVTTNYESDWDDEHLDSDVDAHAVAEEIATSEDAIIVWDCIQPGWA